MRAAAQKAMAMEAAAEDLLERVATATAVGVRCMASPTWRPHRKLPNACLAIGLDAICSTTGWSLHRGCGSNCVHRALRAGSVRAYLRAPAVFARSKSDIRDR